ncbi:MAG: choice-of-anchor Q domain-containing protein [Bacteroidales bacterium]|nr:choice-of-anchor Q domain-containing protein [Bacteroidales bacterium]
MKNYFYFIVFSLLYVMFTSCDPTTNDDVSLQFSVDQVTFDTVFTTVGSTVKTFTVHNKTSSDITTDIRLASGSQSYYSINVDGVAGVSFDDVEIPAHDSIFVFVKVTINPGNQNTPFLVTDSIEFKTGKMQQSVNLVAYGQDAHFIVADSGPSNLRYKIVAGANETTVWTNEKPYVVYGWAVVDSLGTLQIEPGTKIYFHVNSGLWVYRYGHLQAIGNKENPIFFRSDRLDEWFDSDFTQWNRIWIMEGNKENIMDYCVVTNSFVGIQMEAFTEYTGNKTIIKNSIIKNNQNSSIIARWADFEMTNCVVTSSGGCGLQLEVGEWTIKNSTIANYAAIGRDTTTPVVMVSNKSFFDQSSFHSTATFENTIIYGNYTRELVEYKTSTHSLTTSYQNCLIKTNQTLPTFVSCIRNQDPQFVDKSKLDFRLKSTSPAINAGFQNGVLLDIIGNPRTGNPDIGAYEFVN